MTYAPKRLFIATLLAATGALAIAQTPAPTPPAAGEFATQRAAPGERVDGMPVDRDVIAALLRLTVRQRAVVFLTYWADLPPAEIAALLDSSLRTVERELSAAKARLEELLS